MRQLNLLRGLSAEERTLLLVLGGGSFLLMSNLSSINVAVPHIQRDFGAPLSDVKWVAILGFIISASLTLLFGRVGDIYGRGRVYRTGVVVYTAGSLLCALALSLPLLLACRVVMAVGMAMVIPLSGAMLAAAARPERRGQLIGLSASFAAAGQLMGPTIGGFILDVSSWRGIFLFNGGLGLLLCLAQFLLLRRRVDERRPGRLDLVGAILMLVAFPSLLLALSFGPRDGWGERWTLLWFGLAAAGSIAFALREASFPAPLVRLDLFRRLPFVIAMTGMAVNAFVQNPLTLFVPVYLQTVLGLRSVDVGLLMVSLPLAALVAGPIGGRLADRYPPGLVAASGIGLLFMSVLVYAQLSESTAPSLVLVPLVLAGAAGGLSRPANQVVAYRSVEREDYGSLAGMLNATFMLAGTLGTTVAVAVNESFATSTSAAAFAEAQQQTFTLLLPLLVMGVAVSLLGGWRRDHPSVQPVGQAFAGAAGGSQRSP
jgi:EmrB/QacA subfamily drug resistance transporter